MAFGSLAEMRKNRQNLFANAVKEVEKLNSNSNEGQDDRFWQPTTDKAGNGQATLRFLPPPPNEENQWVRYYSHGFKNEDSGKWYIDLCPTTLGRDHNCPVNNVTCH